jgi:Zn-dependent peptidase ImmA (M78 family)/DNA-binding XRE family transcriptional regulator
MGQRSFNPTRLTLARQRNGFTKRRLAELCNVSINSITGWENGTEDPPVELLSRTLSFPSEFFLSDDPLIVSKESVAFRAQSSMSVRQLERVLASTALALEFCKWIEKNYRVPKPNLPDFSEFQHALPAVTAESLRSIWGLYQQPISQLLPLLERKGVRIFSLPIADREIDAFSFWRNTTPYIFLNTGKTAERMRFDLAHELGHLLMHRQILGQRPHNLEQDAQIFASNLLMPADALYAQVTGRLRLADIFTLKRYWRVSAVALVHRLSELSIISEWHYRTWMIELSQRGYRSSEPEGIHPETSQLFKELLRLLREDGWSSRRLAEKLSIPEYEISSFMFGLATALAPTQPHISDQMSMLRSTNNASSAALQVVKPCGSM